jgi:MYXO-CTERM domain-containing protein
LVVLRVVVSLCLLFAPLAAHGKTLTHYDHPLAGADLDRAALAFARTQLGPLGADGATLRPHRTLLLKDGGRVVQLTQEHRGLPVLDAGLSVLVLGGRVAAISGTVHAFASGGTARVDRATAEQAVTRAIPTATVRRARRAFWARGARAVPVWELDVATSRPLGVWRVAVDTGTGQLLWSLSAVDEVKANVYGSNPKVSSLKQIDLEGLDQPEALEGTHADVETCGIVSNKLSCERLAQPDQDGHYLYKPKEPYISDAFAEVHAYHHVDAFHRWLASRFNFARAGSQQIKVVVNLHYVTSSGQKQGYPNAMYADYNGDGKGELIFGQGSRDYAYDADVIYHEFTHSAVRETSGLTIAIDELGLNMMPMGLNEGFADLMSSSYTGDGKVGEYAGGSKGSIRDLGGTPLSCPKSLTGESHSDGLIWGRVNWAIRSQLSNPGLYDGILYKTMVALGKNASFSEAGKLLIKVADATDAAAGKTAKTELTARNILDCSRVVPLEEGVPLNGYTLAGTTVTGGITPGPLQYEIDVPKNASELTIAIYKSGWGSGSIGAYVRKGQPVAFLSKKYDFTKANTASSILLSTESETSTLEPGQKYYVLPLNVGTSSATYKISYSLKTKAPQDPDASPPQDPDAGIPDPDGSSEASTDPGNPSNDGATSGCSCRAGRGGSGGAAALPLALGLLALLVLRRRR